MSGDRRGAGPCGEGPAGPVPCWGGRSRSSRRAAATGGWSPSSWPCCSSVCFSSPPR